MPGWLYVEAEGVRTMRQLRRWVGVGAGYARPLPPEQASPARARSSVLVP